MTPILTPPAIRTLEESELESVIGGNHENECLANQDEFCAEVPEEPAPPDGSRG